VNITACPGLRAGSFIDAAVKNRSPEEGDSEMGKVFSVQDRQAAFEYIRSVAAECGRIVALVQIGSGVNGYHDEYSDLDFVIALDSGESMPEVMEYMHRKISARYELAFFTQNESRHLQNYILADLLEIDIGYGTYEHAAALKPAFKVLFDHSGTVEEKMVQSREWMDDSVYGEKQKKDMEQARNVVWFFLMHAAVAIHRGNCFRAIGEMEAARALYLDLLGDRYRLESARNREIDKLPEAEKAAVRSTYAAGESPSELRTALLNLTALVYKELEGVDVPVTQEMLHDYYASFR
jgi:hypothetical protein